MPACADGLAWLETDALCGLVLRPMLFDRDCEF